MSTAKSTTGIEFTDAQLRGLKAPKGKPFDRGDRFYSNTNPPRLIRNLRHRVTPTGVRSWTYRYNDANGNRKNPQIALYPATPLADARIIATRINTALKESPQADPKAIAEAFIYEQNGEQAPVKKSALTNDKLAARYADILSERNRNWREQTRQLEMYFLDFIYQGKRLGALSPHEITPTHIAAIMTHKTKEGKLRAAQHARSVTRSYFNWLAGTKRDTREVERGAAVTVETTEPIVPDLPPNPCMKVKAPKYKARSYGLQPDEIKDFLKVLDKSTLRLSVKRILQIQLATFSRSGEVAGIPWSEINFRKKQWSIPGARTKNGQDHVVFLSTQIIQLLKEIRAEQKKNPSDYVFPKPRTNDGADRAMGSDCVAKAWNQHRSPDKAGKRVVLDVHKDCTPHSLRRSAVTWAASVGIPQDVREALTNHKQSDSDMSELYNAYEFRTERTEALQRFSDFLS